MRVAMIMWKSNEESEVLTKYRYIKHLTLKEYNNKLKLLY